jgi:predicted RNA-binding protein
MSEENQELNEEEVNLNITTEPTPNQVIDTLADGTEILRDELEEVEEEITDENLRKLVEFTTGEKNLTDERLEALRNDDAELERLIRISMAKSSHFNYAPKKNFGVAYKKERQRKNRQVKKSRTINR